VRSSKNTPLHMTKKYGENWDYFDGYEEEFDGWLERK